MKKYFRHPVFTNYSADEDGSVYSMNYNKTGTIKRLREGNNGNGYLQVSLWKDGKAKQYLVHRFVYECINGAIPDGYHVDHRNFVRYDNRIENLRAIPARENEGRISEKGKKAQVGNGIRNGRRNGAENGRKANSKAVLQFDIDGNLVAKYPSQIEASRRTGIPSQSISSCCLGKLKSAGGYGWAFAPNNMLTIKR